MFQYKTGTALHTNKSNGHSKTIVSFMLSIMIFLAPTAVFGFGNVTHLTFQTAVTDLAKIAKST